MQLISRIVTIIILLLLTACGNQSADPVVVKTPELGNMGAYTDQVAIIFKFYDDSGLVEKSSCDFHWSANNRMTGKCGKLAPGSYVYKLEYRDKITSDLLAQAGGSVDIGQDDDVFILPVIEFNSFNFDSFMARVNAMPTGGDSSSISNDNPQAQIIPGVNPAFDTVDLMATSNSAGGN